MLDLPATVHHRTGDLPAAGALWFVTGRDDDAAALEAISPWRERHGSDPERWCSLPGPLRREVRTGAIETLRAHAGGRADRGSRGGTSEHPDGWWEPLVFGGAAIAVVVGLLALIGIGTWTVFWWIWG